MEPYCIIGLGNPGPRYVSTRHNFGFLLVDELLKAVPAHIVATVKQASSECYEIRSGFEATSDAGWVKKDGSRVIILKPQTFMNLSGDALRELARKYKIVPERVCVLHDELDLPFGSLRLKQGGGLAGHNGLKSISSVLGSRDFFRIRLGIGRPEGVQSVSDYVLTGFDADQRAELPAILSRGEQMIRRFCERGFADTQAEFHSG